MSNGNHQYYLPAFGNEGNRHPLQLNAQSGVGLPPPPSLVNDGISFSGNNQPGVYQPANAAGPLPMYQGASMPNQYGIQGATQGHSNIPIEYMDAFNTPRSNSGVQMTGGSPSTQSFTPMQYGALTQSPTNMQDLHGQTDAFRDVTNSGEHSRGYVYQESHNGEDTSGQPPSKKKKGKNGEAIVSGSGSGTEEKDKEKEKEKDNRRKT
ncbi:hypothetical protein QFC19_001779 [Naganishia cerealis]|uniref:Uncharacterized protein n=1 Tax=Naganishia cerealis TaxID=610337 RepID=A0ACC2WEC8_9TREE|nr:hypothetical protein QFC19_001779 [Naganishia cerealis]